MNIDNINIYTTAAACRIKENNNNNNTGNVWNKEKINLFLFISLYFSTQ